MRKSSLFLIFLAVCISLLVLMIAHASVQVRAGAASLQANADLVGRLDLTDICLFTEASYTRHPSQTDLHTPFQNAPLSFEHFPSGSLVPPPPAPRKIHEPVD
jgi:hypothetical protein